jgi:hypothetical protein
LLNAIILGQRDTDSINLIMTIRKYPSRTHIQEQIL